MPVNGKLTQLSFDLQPPVIEEWRSIDGWPEYEVSSEGRVRNVVERVSTWVGRILKPNPGQDGHLRLTLYRDGKCTYVSVHCLVCRAFHGDRPTPNHEVAHNDGNPGNNRFENLRWATEAENQRDRLKHGTDSCGEKNGWSKLTENQVIEIKMQLAAGRGAPSIAREFGTSHQNVYRIKHGTAWRHI